MCGACHAIPGVHGANATVGPPLDRIAARMYLGGHLTNTPANMMKWIQHPQAIDPKNAMPELGVTNQDVKDIAGVPVHAPMSLLRPTNRRGTVR